MDINPGIEIVNDAYNFDGVINAFIAFNSIIDEKIYIIYTNKDNSIISFNVTDKKKIKEIKNSPDNKITNYRHCLDKANKRDLCISISSSINNIKLWNANSLELLFNFENIYDSGKIKSACFLNDNDGLYIIASNSNYYDKTKLIQVYDLKGNKVKEISNSKDDTYYIETYHDKNSNINYIITGNFLDVKSYNYNDDKLYFKYSDQFSKEHRCIVINDKDEKEVKLIESSKDGNIRVWDFHSGKLLQKIELSMEKLFEICLWDSDHVYVGCGEEIIRLVDIKNGKIIKHFQDFNSVIGLKKINDPILGECLLSQGNEIEQILLWKKK